MMVFAILFFVTSGSFASAFVRPGSGFGRLQQTYADNAIGASSLNSPLQMTDTGLGLGEFAVSLTKPLGIILEERNAGEPGVQIASLAEGGTAEQSGALVRGDVLISADGVDLAASDFDTAMETIIASPENRPLEFVFSDGLGVLDMPKNVLSKLKSNEAIFADALTRAAVRKVRRIGTAQIGDLLSVEVVIGAGVRDNGKTCQVRFFAICSTDTVTTYSCSISATGRRQEDASIEVVALSCAKDEGWGQTFDLIREDS